MSSDRGPGRVNECIVNAATRAVEHIRTLEHSYTIEHVSRELIAAVGFKLTRIIAVSPAASIIEGNPALKQAMHRRRGAWQNPL